MAGNVRAYDSKDEAGKKAVALAVEKALAIQTSIDAVDKSVESKIPAKSVVARTHLSAPSCDTIGSQAPVTSSSLQEAY